MRRAVRDAHRRSAIHTPNWTAANKPTAMTQILSFLCDRFIAQVSDRRLTRPDGTLYDDHTNKNVIYDGRSCFSYTGLSELEGEPTNTWLAKVLSEPATSELREVIEHLAHRATNALRTSNVRRRDRRLTIAGVAWVVPRDTRRPTATSIQISNSSRGRIEDRFAVEFSSIGPRGPAWLLLDAGVPLTEQSRGRLEAELKHNLKHKSSPQKFVESLVRTVRDSADADHRISPRALSALIPRAALAVDSGSWVVVTGPLVGNTGLPTFQYWEPGDWNGITYGPAVAAPGLVLTNFESGPLLPDLGGLATAGSQITLTYPIAILVGPKIGVVSTTHKGKTYAAAFSDTSLMAAFIRSNAPSARPHVIATPEDFRDLMRSLDATCDFIAFNPNGNTDQRHTLSVKEILGTPPKQLD